MFCVMYVLYRHLCVMSCMFYIDIYVSCYICVCYKLKQIVSQYGIIVLTESLSLALSI